MNQSIIKWVLIVSVIINLSMFHEQTQGNLHHRHLGVFGHPNMPKCLRSASPQSLEVFFIAIQSLWPAIKTYWECRAPGLSAVGWKVPKKMSENWVQPKDFPISPIYHIWVLRFCPKAIPKKSDLAGEVWLWAPLNPPNWESENLN